MSSESNNEHLKKPSAANMEKKGVSRYESTVFIDHQNSRVHLELLNTFRTTCNTFSSVSQDMIFKDRKKLFAMRKHHEKELMLIGLEICKNRVHLVHVLFSYKGRCVASKHHYFCQGFGKDLRIIRDCLMKPLAI